MTGYRNGNLRGIQGAGNEQLVAARAVKHGFIAFFKLWSDTKYDMVIDCDGELFRVHYDAVRTHLAIGTTPAEAAGLHLPDGFRWKTILERAVTRNVTEEATDQTTAKSPD